GVQAQIGHRRRMRRKHHRPRGPWISSGIGGPHLDHPLRRTNLVETLPEAVQAMLVTSLPNVRYLTGFSGSNAQLLIGRQGAVFFTDGRYTEQSHHEVPDIERVTYQSGGWARSVQDACVALGATAV